MSYIAHISASRYDHFDAITLYQYKTTRWDPGITHCTPMSHWFKFKCCELVSVRLCGLKFATDCLYSRHRADTDVTWIKPKQNHVPIVQVQVQYKTAWWDADIRRCMPMSHWFKFKILTFNAPLSSYVNHSTQHTFQQWTHSIHANNGRTAFIPTMDARSSSIDEHHVGLRKYQRVAVCETDSQLSSTGVIQRNTGVIVYHDSDLLQLSSNDVHCVVGTVLASIGMNELL